MNQIKEILIALNKERVIYIDTKFLAMDIKISMCTVCLFISQFIISLVLVVTVAILITLYA